MIEVLIRNQNDTRVPSQTSVPITAGDTLTFKTEQNADCSLYFSDGSESVFAPPAPSEVDIDGGSSKSFTFAGASRPACVLVLAQDAEAPQIIDCTGSAGTLTIKYNKGRSGPSILTDPTGSGT